MWRVWPNSTKLSHIQQNTSHVKNPTEFLTPIFAENIKCKISDLIGQTWGIRSNTSQMWRVWPNSTNLSHIQQNTSHAKNPTEFLTPIFYQNVSHVRNSTVYVTCEEIRSNTLQLWNYGKIDLICHTIVTHLTENITYEKYVPVSHTYNSPKCVTCNTSDQIYLARDKFDRKLPCCKNNSTELFLVVTYLTKYMTCKKSDRISHTYISPKMFQFIKNLFTCVQAIEILMCGKLVWVKNSKSAKRILHLCPNVKNSVEFITPAWGIRSVRNTVQHSLAFLPS